jgi:hypothetical protein
MPHAVREQRAPHQFDKVAIAQVGHEHAWILRYFERRTDPHADRFQAETVEVVARQRFTEALRHTVETVGTQRRIGIEHSRGRMKADRVIGARKQHALHAMLLRRRIQVVHAANIRFEQIVERRIDGDAAQMHDGVDAFEQRIHARAVGEIQHHMFFMLSGFAQRRDVRQTHDVRPICERTAQLPTEIAGRAGQQKPSKRLTLRFLLAHPCCFSISAAAVRGTNAALPDRQLTVLYARAASATGGIVSAARCCGSRGSFKTNHTTTAPIRSKHASETNSGS